MALVPPREAEAASFLCPKRNAPGVPRRDHGYGHHARGLR